jgi:hypothetical protein
MLSKLFDLIVDPIVYVVVYTRFNIIMPLRVFLFGDEEEGIEYDEDDGEED